MTDESVIPESEMEPEHDDGQRIEPEPEMDTEPEPKLLEPEPEMDSDPGDVDEGEQKKYDGGPIPE